MGRSEEEKRRGKLVDGGRKWTVGQSDLFERSVTVAAPPAAICGKKSACTSRERLACAAP
jgi:hypothetical protein